MIQVTTRSETIPLSTLWPKQPCLFTDSLLQVLHPGKLFLSNSKQVEDDPMKQPWSNFLQTKHKSTLFHYLRLLWSYQISFWLMHHSVEYDLLLTINKPSGQWHHFHTPRTTTDIFLKCSCPCILKEHDNWPPKAVIFASFLKNKRKFTLIH